MIQPDKRNYRIHNDKNKQLIKKSVDELGAGRSILIDSDNEIIAGNGVFEQWGNRPIKIIETNGDELIVVKRTDLKRTDSKRTKLAILDNSASDSSEFDYELLKEDFGDLQISELDNLGLDYNKIIESIDSSKETSKNTFEDEFNGSDDSNCKMPIVPEFMEDYNCFVIVCTNKIDELFIRNILGITKPIFSNDKGLSDRLTNVITVDMLKNALCHR